MKSILLCNVGGNDVHLEGQPLPKGEMRAKGRELSAGYSTHADRITSPLVDRAVDYVFEQKGDMIERLLLFVTDQAEGEHRGSDTVFCGEVIKQRVESVHKAKVGKTFLVRLDTQINPADYDDTLQWFAGQLLRVREKAGEVGCVYLLLSGGTPAMNNALLLCGVDTFGAQATCLYLPRGAQRPFTLRVGATLRARSVCEGVEASLRSYSYSAALSLVRPESGLFPDVRQYQVLTGLLAYGQSRLAFDFEEARRDVDSALTAASGGLRGQLQEIVDGLLDRPRAWLLKEVLFGIEARLEAGLLIDLLAHVFRFQEGVLRAVVEQLGLRFEKEGRHLDLASLRGIDGLEDYLGRYAGFCGGFDAIREVSRVTMEAILQFFAEECGNTKALTVMNGLARLNSLAQIRNAIVHGQRFPGVSMASLSEALGEDATRIPAILREVYRVAFGEDAGENVFGRLNYIVEEVVAGVRVG